MPSTRARSLNLGDDLALPLDVVSRRTTILGQTDTGKTSTAVVMVEEASAAGAQFVVIDPTGAWWGLTSNADGDGPGVDCVVMGGRHGDVPIDEHAGREVARLVADEGYNLVIDLDGLRSWSARQRFTADFASELYERAHSQILVVIDEAHRLAPQGRLEDNGHAARCLGAVSDVVLLGRRRGLATLMVCQRPAKLHKDVLEMSEVLIAHRVRGNNDRKALQGWVEEADLDVKALMGEIAGLPKGIARVSAPTIGINSTHKIRAKRTFDSSKSIGVGEVEITPKARAHVDMGALAERMAAVVERAAAEDPKLLAKRVRELEGQIASLQGAKSEPEIIERVVEVFPEGWETRLVELQGLVRPLLKQVEHIYGAATELRAEQARIESDFRGRDSEARNAPARTKGSPVTAVAPPPAAPPASGDGGGRALSPVNGTVNGPRQRILDTIAWFNAIGVTAPRRGAVAPLAGTTSTSSGFEKNLSGLRTSGLIEYPAGGRLALTAAGMVAAHAPEGTPTTEALQEAILSKLNGPRAAIVRVLIDAYPAALARDELAQRVDVSPVSSGFEKNLSGLRTLELVGYPARGEVVALPVLFIEDR